MPRLGPGIVHIIGPEQGFTVRNDEIFFSYNAYLHLAPRYHLCLW